MDGTSHILIGIAADAAAYATKPEPITLERALTRALWATIGAKLPDLIEPADHPGHRKFFHSLSFGILFWKICESIEKANPNTPLSDAVAATRIGFTSHLVADSTTPSSIPLWIERD